jgi:uncharacterized protein
MKSKKTSPRKGTAASVRSRQTAAGESTSAEPAHDPSQPRSARRKKSESPGPETESGPARKRTLKVPPILLEGDRPTLAPLSGPGQRYALGPTPPTEHLETEGELPEAYGTRQLLLAARDPHWLYAHWDLTVDQQRQYNSLARDKHLALRVFVGGTTGTMATEVEVHPESRHWFVHVDGAGTQYVAELGYYRKEGTWTAVSTSGPTLTPPDNLSPDTSAEFTSIPFDLPLARLLALVKDAVQENVPLARALQELRSHGHPDLPAPGSAPGKWTADQERALADLISMDQVRRVWMGSLEITELIRRQALQELASQAAALWSLPTSPGVSSLASWHGQPAKGFWFNVNAELIVYGATEPKATVTIGGREVKLRADGTFSYRFALPDGQYELPVVAISPDQTDGRAAEMKFSRGTEYHGEVGATPQDPQLKLPEPASV